MARHPFGGGIDDWIFGTDAEGRAFFEGGAVLTFWNAREGGTQYTDLTQDPEGDTPIAVLVSSTGGGGYRKGEIPVFYGPPDVTTMWVSGDGGERVAIDAIDVGDIARQAQQDLQTHVGNRNAHGTGLGDLSDVQVGPDDTRAVGDLVGWNGSAFAMLTPAQASGAVLLNPPTSGYLGNVVQPPPAGQINPWLQMRQPYSAADSNPDGLAFYSTHTDGTTPVKTWWLDGNNQQRAAPSTPTRLAGRVFEAYEAVGGPSTGRFWEISTNPTNPNTREALFGAFGTGHPTQPGWMVATRVLAGQLGVRAGGAYNGLAPLNFRGYKSTPGVPTSGAWATNDVVVDSAGAVHICTAGGAPGAWSSTGGLALGWVDVRAHGAKGDGVADDTAAIQAAINALPTTGGTVYLARGTYKISAALVLRSRLSLIGDGDNTSVILQTSTTANGLAGVDIDRLTVSRLRVMGPASGSGVGVNLTRSANDATTYVTLSDVIVDQWGSDGIAVSNLIVSRLERVIAQANGGHGINLYGNTPTGAAGTSVALASCYGNGNQQAGIRLYNMCYVALMACAADSNGVGYLLDYCQGVSLAGCGAESTVNRSATYDGASLRINNSFGIDVRAFWVYLNNAIGVHVTGGARWVTLAACSDIDPGGSAASFIRVESGCGVTMIGNRNTTANFLAAGTTQVLDDGNGGVSLRGALSSASSGYFEGNLISGGGNLVAGTAGKGLHVKEGANARMGTAVLVAGTVTVPNTSVTANSRIFLTAQTPGGTPGALYVNARTAGASFVVKSTSASDTSTVAYHVIEPAS